MSLIKNRETLLLHGNTTGRRHVLDILETGMAAADPFDNVMRCLRIEGKQLVVGSDDFRYNGVNALRMPYPRPFAPAPLTFDLDEVGDIYVVGGGKAAQRMAEGIEAVLGDRITEGHICAKKGETVRLKRIGVTLAGHPIPDADSVSGATKILAIERQAKKGDIVFFSMSGGGSALMTLPAPGLTLHDVQEVNRVLYFENGAPMQVANCVRSLITVLRHKHSRYVGDAAFIGFTTSEQPKVRINAARLLPPDGITDYEFAIDLLKQYNSWEGIPESVRQFLLEGAPAHQLLKPHEWWDRPHFFFRVMGPEVMLDAALARSRDLGLNAEVLVSNAAGLDARTIGEWASYQAREVIEMGRPAKAPCVWITGGELVVPTGQEHGLGGRNQEFALAAALHIGGCEQAVIASADSDGRDGPSQHAGAIVDGYTLSRAAELGIDVSDVLLRHDTDPAFRALGDAIETGVLLTNVQDLRVIYVGNQA